MSNIICTQCGDRANTKATAPVVDVPARGDDCRVCYDGEAVYIHESDFGGDF